MPYQSQVESLADALPSAESDQLEARIARLEKENYELEMRLKAQLQESGARHELRSNRCSCVSVKEHLKLFKAREHIY